MKKILVVLVTLMIAINSMATTYYFSSSSGKDGNVTNTITTPWQTLDKASRITFKPNDKILFKCGDVWSGTFNPHGDGTPQLPVIISSYGVGAMPVFSGFTTVSSWTSIGNGIFRSNPLSPQSKIHMVVLDGKPVEQGRYPNNDAPEEGWLRLESFINGNTITDDELKYTPIDESWKGATLMVRPYRSYLDDCPITSIDRNNNSITFNPRNLTVGIGEGYGYFVTNSLKTLDQYGEWYYNPTDHCLYMFFGTEAPPVHTVQASTTDILLHPISKWYFVYNIKFTGANKYGIECNYKGISGLRVENCYINQIGMTGIALAWKDNFKLYNSVIEQTNCNGAILGYRCDNDSVISNRISDICLLKANCYKDTAYQNRMGFAVFSADQELKGLTAMYNHIYNVGFMGIFFNRSNNYIYKNYIHDFEKLLDDGAGIYSANAPNAAINGNNIIRRNVVVHGQGNGYGGFVYSYYMGDAIFVDDRANPTTIDSNVALYCGDYGIDIHNAQNPVVTNNIIGFNLKYQIHLQHDAGFPDVHAVINNNEIYVQDLQLMYGFYIQSGATFVNTATIDKNILCLRRANDYNIAYVQSKYITNFSGFFPFLQWKTLTKYDVNSIYQTTYPDSATYVSYYTSDKPQTFKFIGQTLYKVDGTPVKDSISLPDHWGVVLKKYTVTHP